MVGFVYYSLHVVDRLHQNINDKLVNPTTLDILNLDEFYSSIVQDNFISLQTVCLLRKTPEYTNFTAKVYLCNSN